jgi:hypothetical protein
VKRVIVGETAIWIEVDRAKLIETLLGHEPEFIDSASIHGLDAVKLKADFQAYRRGNVLYIAGPKDSSCEGTQTPSLVKAVARARGWYERVISGEVGTMGGLAQQSGLTATYTKRILQCALLSPQVTESILSGKHRFHLTLHELLQNIPIAWEEQDKLLQS